MTVQILVGDCRQTLAHLAAQTFHTCVTSPPYFGLRDYGTPPLYWPAMEYSPMPGMPPCVEVPSMTCSLGLEPTLEAFIGHQLQVFRCVRRVLRDDGTLWLNMGDSYAGARDPRRRQSAFVSGKSVNESAKAAQAMTASRRRDNEPIPRSDIAVAGLKAKDMMGQPWRLALALQADGWWLRRDVIWHKPNPMPESAGDRPTTAHEYLFLLSKSEQYYYNAEAIKEPASPDTNARYARGRSQTHKHAAVAAVPGKQPQKIAQGFEHMQKPVGGWANGAGTHMAVDHQQEDESRRTKLLAKPPGNGVGWGHGYDADARERGRVHGRKIEDRPDGAGEDGKGERMGREPGWRERERKFALERDAKNNASFDAAMVDMPGERNKRSVWTIATEGFPGAHFATFPTKLVEPCILAGCPPGGNALDCFGGSGTVGVVADRLQRNAVLCELNPGYAQMADDRVHGDAPLFAEVDQQHASAEQDNNDRPQQADRATP